MCGRPARQSVLILRQAGRPVGSGRCRIGHLNLLRSPPRQNPSSDEASSTDVRTDGRTDAVSAMERVQAPRGRRCQIYSRTLKAGESGSRARSQGRRPIVFPSRVRPSITAADEIKYGRRLSVGPSGRANERQSRDGRQTIVDKAGRPGSGGRTVSRWPDTTNPRRTNLTQRRYQRQRGATLTSRGQTSERMIARRTASSPPRPTTTHDARRMHCVASR